MIVGFLTIVKYVPDLKVKAIGGVLVGDSGYPLRPYLITPLLHPQTRAERRFNRAHCRSRVVVENLFGVWKRRFPCLQLVLRLEVEITLAVIVACAVLHNLACQMAAPLPQDEAPEQPYIPVAIPAVVNQGGKPVRALMIRNFE